MMVNRLQDCAYMPWNVMWFFSEREYAIARPSVDGSRLVAVCNARAPYSGGSNFRQHFYGIR